MKGTRTTAALAALLLFAGVSEAAAQAPRLTLTPAAGLYYPTRDLGRVDEGGDAVPVFLDQSAMAGLSVEAAFPAFPVQARGRILYAPRTHLVAERLVGEEPCGTGCTRFIYDQDELASGSVLVAVAEAVLRAPERFPLRPYLAAGGGLRRYAFAQDDLEGEFAEAFADDVSRFVAHVGVGFDVAVGRMGVNVEVGDHLGRYRIDPGAGGVGAEEMQHDLTASLGVRIALP